MLFFVFAMLIIHYFCFIVKLMHLDTKLVTQKLTVAVNDILGLVTIKLVNISNNECSSRTLG